MNDHLEYILLTVSKSPLIDNGELLKAYRLVINSIQDGLKIERAGIWFVKTDYSEINCQLLIDTKHNSEIESLVISASDYPNYFSALKTERAILANDAHHDHATAEFSQGYLGPLGINSMLDVPIRHKGEMIGIICCEHIGQMRQWTKDEARFAASMADLVGRAINASAYKASESELKKINDQLEQTIEVRTAQLVESEKMAALGNLVAGVAHEVNTPLGISITTSSTLFYNLKQIEKSMRQGRLSETVFVKFLAENTELHQLLENNLSRAAILIQNFKQTAVDHSDQNKHIFNVGESIRYLLLSLKPETTKRQVRIDLEVEDNLSIFSYPSAWTQIMSNLILNSCSHAFDNSAEPIISIDIHQNNEQIILEYRDNGSGIEPENLAKVILPFYTTKRGQGGTGLGLSIVYNLVKEQLDGNFSISSDIGQGIYIKIVCPFSQIDSDI
jgi:two-component system, NtrC family, sensor kinase